MRTIVRCRTALLFSLLALTPLFAFGFDDFKPVAPEELAMKDNPKQPGAHAMVLEVTDSEDDNQASAEHYKRLKIFSEEGKKYADIEIPYLKGSFSINNIKARTVRPDGTIVPFNGQIYDKLVVKSKHLKFQAKTFTLPDVQPGSIIEYKYRVGWDHGTLYSTHWDLQDDLFMKKAVYTIKPYDGLSNYGFAYIGVGIKQGKLPMKNGAYVLELNDVAAFDSEKYSPPERELKPRIEFFYTESSFGNQDQFWKKTGQSNFHEIEDFIGHRGGIHDAAAGMVAASDSGETKLRKIYDRVQQLKNLSYSLDLTEQESKRQKMKDVNNSEDVLKRGYGYRYQLNRLYAALVRAAGLQADMIMVSQRDEVFFRKDLLDAKQLNGEIVLATADGKQFYLDPGTPMCPFGLIPWKSAGVTALQVAKDGGSFIRTPAPLSAEAVTRRIAELKMDDNGFKGNVTVLFMDQEALTWRLNEVTSDEAELKTDLENDMKKMLPAGSKVTLASIENQKDETKPLIAHYDVELPFIGSSVGSRMLLPMEIFQAGRGNPFLHEGRVHPIYFDYPYQELDEVRIEMPKDFKLDVFPQPKKEQTAFGYYDATWAMDGQRLFMGRRFAIHGLIMPQSLYPDMRSFFQKVSSGDQETVVLREQAVANK